VRLLLLLFSVTSEKGLIFHTYNPYQNTNCRKYDEIPSALSSGNAAQQHNRKAHSKKVFLGMETSQPHHDEAVLSSRCLSF